MEICSFQVKESRCASFVTKKSLIIYSFILILTFANLDVYLNLQPNSIIRNRQSQMHLQISSSGSCNLCAIFMRASEWALLHASLRSLLLTSAAVEAAQDAMYLSKNTCISSCCSLCWERRLFSQCSLMLSHSRETGHSKLRRDERAEWGWREQPAERQQFYHCHEGE